jgi:hypothetical protein
MHQIHLHGKMIHYGTKITYIYVRTPNSNKRYYWNCSGKCNNINLTMGEYVMNSSMISIPMGGAYVVLGIQWLPLAEWWYNTSFHTTTKMTPFMELYGYHPPSITSSLKKKSKVQAVEDHIENQQEVLQILKDNLTMAHNRMKQQEDQHRSERSFEVGDWVFLRLQPYKQMSLKKDKKDNKLSPKYYGPYKVLQNIGTMAYKLELPAPSRVHPVFHV